MTPADTCRAKGWTVGTYLRGSETAGAWTGTDIIHITAIGEDGILARTVAHNGKPIQGRENTWSLDYRDWQVVAPADLPPGVLPMQAARA